MQRAVSRAAAIQLVALFISASAYANAITSTNPVRNAKAASRSTNIQATADSNIESTTVTQSTFRIQGEQTGRLAGTYSASGTTFQLDPTNHLKPGELIRVSATSGIQSTTAVALTPRVWQFTAATAKATGVMEAHSTPSFGGGSGFEVALGDVDADGDLDAIVANMGGPDTVWLNGGTGIFTAHPTTPSLGIQGSLGIALGDVDGDGDLDAVVSKTSGGGELVWINDGTGAFSAHPTTPQFGGGSGGDVELGDLDGDGDLDAVVANSDDVETVWRNDGSGNFSAHPTTPTFGSADFSFALALGDLDGDGDLDVVVANGNVGENETVWLNDGTGSFSAHPTTPSIDGGNSSGVALGDLDGDGDLDAVFANQSFVAETVWLNNGTGSFSAHPTTPTFGLENSYDVALGDIDGDGDLDAIVANFGTAETVWRNDGAGNLSAHPSTPSFGAENSTGVTLGDLDGDGDLDVVVSNTFNGPETVWLNAAITLSPTSAVVTTEAGGNAAFDIVLDTAPSANVSVQVDTSDSTEGRVSTDGFTQQTSVTLTFTTSNWSTPQTVTVHGQNDDIDDGNIAYTLTTAAATSTDALVAGIDPFDVSASNTDNDTAGVTVTPTTVTVAESGTTAPFTVVLTSEPTGNVVIDVASGDTSEATVSPAQLTFNNSDWATPKNVTVTGVHDAIDDGDQATNISVSMNVASTADTLYDAINPADVTATTTDDDFVITSLSPAANAGSVPRSATIQVTTSDTINGTTVTQSTFRIQGDLTGRIAGTYSAFGSTFELDPTNNFKPGENIRATATNGIQSASALLLAPHVWQFTAAAGVATGAMRAHPTTPSFGAGYSIDAALGDLDGDGDLDVVVANWASVDTVWINDGTGSVSAHPTTPTFADIYGQDVALGDLDGDGDLDAIVANTDNATGQPESVWSNDGAGNLSALSTFGASKSTAVALGDLDGDGDLDAVIANELGQAETVWLNNGTGTFSAHPTTPSFGAGSSYDATLGDLDGDGDLDCIITNSNGESETVWLNNGTGSFSAHPTTPSFGAGSSYGLALGDLDGDGDVDAVVANAFGEAETVWVNNGSGGFSAHPTTPNVGTGDSRTVALGDLDGDGDFDAVVSNANLEAETVWLNDGAGNFSANAAGSSFGSGYSYGLALGDLNGDSTLDVVVANSSGEAETVWLNRDPAGITVTPTSGLITTEAGGNATFTVVLDTPPIANVSVQLDTSDATEGRISTDGTTQQNSVTLTFTSANWSTPRTITVHGQNDDVDDGNINYTITTAAATSSDALYSGFNAADVSASNTDNDTAGVTVTPLAVSVGESGTTEQFTLVLTSQPTGNVVIDVSSGDTGEATVAPSQVTFTNVDWSTPKPITVTGVNDLLADGDQVTTIHVTMNAASTADALYDAIDPANVTATTVDDEFFITSTSPAANAKAASRATNVQAATNDPVQSSTVNATSLRIQGDLTGRINGTYSAAGSTFQLDPTNDLKPGENVHVSATSAIQSASAAALLPRVWQFTAGTAAATGAMALHPNAPAFGSGDTYDVALGDLDGDGDLDAVIANGSSPVTVWMNGGLGNFSPHPTVPSFGTTNKIGVALGDLDGDGDLDAVFVSYSNETDSIWLNDGTGGFGLHQTFGSGSGREALLGDLDRDGDLDLVVVNDSGQAETVWLNNGSATFSAHPTTPELQAIGSSQSRAGALGDLDGDGDLDAVIANELGQAETVWLNDGTGSFSAHPTTPLFGAANPQSTSYDVALGDLDGDGDLDAVVANASTFAETVWLNDGTGSFTPHATPSFGGENSRDVALGDLDGDGDLDAVIGNSGSAQTVWLNNGSGVFTAHPTIPSFGSASMNELALGDLDGDGDLDVLLTTDGAAKSVWLNTEISVTPTSGLVTSEGGATGTFTVVLNKQPSSDVSIQVTSADPSEGWVSTDGFTQFTSVSLTFNSGNWSTPRTITVHGRNDSVDDGDVGYTITLAAATSADALFSGSDPADVTVTNTDDDTVGVTVTPASVTVRESATTAQFTIVLGSEPTGDVIIDISSGDTGEATISPASRTFTNANWATPQAVTVTGVDDALFDGSQNTTISVTMNAGATADSIYDAIDPADVTATTSDDEFVVVSTNPAKNTKAAPRTTNLEATASGTVQPASVTQSTFRVQGSLTGRIAGTYGATGTTFQLDPTSNLKPGETIRATATNGILGPNDSPLVPHVWQFTTAAGVATGVMTSHPTTPSFGGQNTWDLALGDLDGDGDLDAIASNQQAQFETVWSNDGAGNFSALSTFDGGWYNNGMALGDLDGDGDLDVLITGSDVEAVFLNNGSGTFSAHPLTPTFGVSAQKVALGDLDGDGDLDAVLAIFGGPETVWRNDGTGAFSAHPTPSFGGDNSQGIALGDLDGDGDLDAIVANADDDGEPETVWLNDGTGVFTAHATPTFGGGQSFVALLGDLDGDGDLDVLIVNDYGSETVWLNDGSGVFTQHGTVFGPSRSDGGALGDLDGDGDLDAIITDILGPATVWLNNGTGGFSAHPTLPAFGAGQPVPVALGDLDGDGDLDAVVGNYDNGAETVWINRNAAGITVDPTSGLTTSEAGGTATFTVVLDSPPVADVSIQLSSSDTTEAKVSDDGATQQNSVTLTFTSANWNTPKTITVHGQNDDVDDGDVAYTINTAAATSTDVLYSGFNAADVSASNTDNDTAGVTVTPTTLSVNESGTNDEFTVALESEPTGNVVIDVASGDTSEATVSPAQLTFTTSNWATPQPVTVTGVNDTVGDGNQNTTISVTTDTAATADDLYDAINPADVTATTIDNDTAGVTVAQSGGTTVVTEAGSTDTFTVVLTSEPTGAVVIDVSSGDTGEATVSPAQLTFNSADWSTPKTVTVTGVNDTIDDGDQITTISLTMNTGATADSVYDAIDPADVNATTTDDDNSTSTSLISSLNPSLSGQSVTFTASVTSGVGGTITGTITFKDGAATIGTATLSSGSASMSTATLSVGPHAITAVYGGGSNFLGSTSNTVNQVVNASSFGAPPFFTATATNTSQATLSWGAVSGATSYEVFRTTSILVAYTFIGSAVSTSYNDSGLSANTTYLYKVRAVASGGGTSAFSAVDAATTIVFTDPTLSAAITVKTTHIAQLRIGANAMRTAAGLAGATFTDPTLTATVTKIKRIHIIELRSALDAARSSIGLSALTYTDPTITVGVTRVKKEHISELRGGTQ